MHRSFPFGSAQGQNDGVDLSTKLGDTTLDPTPGASVRGISESARQFPRA